MCGTPQKLATLSRCERTTVIFSQKHIRMVFPRLSCCAYQNVSNTMRQISTSDRDCDVFVTVHGVHRLRYLPFTVTGFDLGLLRFFFGFILIDDSLIYDSLWSISRKTLLFVSRTFLMLSLLQPQQQYIYLTCLMLTPNSDPISKEYAKQQIPTRILTTLNEHN